MKYMREFYKNKGKYVNYVPAGTQLSFRDDAFCLDLAELQKDYPVEITLYEDHMGKLTTDLSRRYLAEITIPARRSVVEKTGVTDAFGFPVLKKTYLPLDMDEVEITLWAQREEV